MKIKDIDKIQNLFAKPQKVVIITHWSPDGDAMGSSLGLYNYLTRKKHKVTVVTPNDYPSFLHWLPGNNKVIDNKLNTKEAKNKITKADVIFCLDFNSLKRIDELGEVVERSKGIKFIIDHHQQPDGFADYLVHDTAASSTSELVYEFIAQLGDGNLVTEKIASCLYTGIMTDTGSFSFSSTSSNTHRIAAKLIEAGAKGAAIHDAVYEGKTEERIKLLGYCLSEKLKVLHEQNTAFITLSNDELKNFNFKKGDTEGIVNYALSIKGVEFAAFFVERDGIIKTSFRSKGKFDVNQFARKHFEGGGHKNAAGGSCNLSLDETIVKFIEILPKYKKQLHS